MVSNRMRGFALVVAAASLLASGAIAQSSGPTSRATGMDGRPTDRTAIQCETNGRAMPCGGPDRPLVTSVPGGVAIQGTTPVTVQGTASVAIQGTPGVTLQGAPPVTVQGTVPVSIAGRLAVRHAPEPLAPTPSAITSLNSTAASVMFAANTARLLATVHVPLIRADGSTVTTGAWCAPVAAAVKGPPSIYVAPGGNYTPGANGVVVPSAAISCIAVADGTPISGWQY